MNKPSAFDVALDALRRYIVAQQLSPGDPLPPVAELAERVGVSQATLREALRAWEAAGILTIRHGVGAFVQRYNWAPILQNLSVSALFEPEQAALLLQLREALELGTLPRAIERLSTADLDALAALAEELSTDEDGLSAEFRLHLRLVQAVENPLIEELLRLTWLAGQQAAPEAPPARPLRYALHVELVQALQARDLGAAQAALRRYFQQLAIHRHLDA